MTYLPPLEELDADGAIREGAESVDGNTRADFLRRAGLGAGAVIGSGAILGALPAVASAGVSPSDIAILNFALTLEYLEAAFYAEAVSKGKLSGETAKFAEVVAAHERAHVAFLKGTLGAKAVKKPRFNFRDTTSDQAKFRATAKTLEDTGVAAYLGQVGNIRSKAVLKAAGSILPIEARHAAWIRDIIGSGNGPSPAPRAFEGARTKG
ncbi:MAG: ferritin-like domain-containing protein, partial [Actinomycetota bacterium]|nr:ferritin-like domain-containing protein [Actinomycetota bacterium]